DTHILTAQSYILHGRSGFPRQGKVLFEQSLCVTCADDVILGQTFQFYKTAIVDNPLKLCNGLHETADGFFIPDFFRDKGTSAKRTKVALHPHPLFGGLGQKEVTVMVEERTFVKMLLIGFRKEPLAFPCNIRRITFLDIPVLLVDNGVVRQSLDSLVPSRMYGIVLGRCYREQFRQQ